MNKFLKDQKNSDLNVSDEILSTDQILKEIGNAVNKEKKRRTEDKKKYGLEVINLEIKSLVKKGIHNFEKPMPNDLATLKSLIQTVVREEIHKLKSNKDLEN